MQSASYPLYHLVVQFHSLCRKSYRQVEEVGLREAVLCEVYTDEGASLHRLGVVKQPSQTCATGHELSGLDLHLPCAKGTAQVRGCGGMRSLW